MAIRDQDIPLTSSNVGPRTAPALLRTAFSGSRLLPVLSCCVLLAMLFSIGWRTSLLGLWIRVVGIGLLLLFVFAVFERWPRRLPRWIARWALQVVTVGATVPIATASIYVATTSPGDVPFWSNSERLSGFLAISVAGMLVAPWVALAALLAQRDARVSELATAVELQRSELERRSTEARLNLLASQVKPHFLFNTLANVHALVEIDSPRASQVLESLIAYLRAAVPRLGGGEATLRDELELVSAYLELMQLRMPDRLAISWQVDETVSDARCPPLTVLTLVENAVRHGLDPKENGGTLSISIGAHEGNCVVRVEDDGVGPTAAPTPGPGIGLRSLRERLLLEFRRDVSVELIPATPKGAIAVVRFPLERALR